MIAQLIALGVFDADPTEVRSIADRIRSDSIEWTGIERRLAANPEAVKEFQQAIGLAHSQLAMTGLTNVERAKAHAILCGLEKLIESPEPEWRAILNLFSSPALNNIMGIANILMLVFQISALI
jgi:hypothetical protein